MHPIRYVERFCRYLVCRGPNLVPELWFEASHVIGIHPTSHLPFFRDKSHKFKLMVGLPYSCVPGWNRWQWKYFFFLLCFRYLFLRRLWFVCVAFWFQFSNQLLATNLPVCHSCFLESILCYCIQNDVDIDCTFVRQKKTNQAVLTSLACLSRLIRNEVIYRLYATTNATVGIFRISSWWRSASTSVLLWMNQSSNKQSAQPAHENTCLQSEFEQGIRAPSRIRVCYSKWPGAGFHPLPFICILGRFIAYVSDRLQHTKFWQLLFSF